MGRWISPEMIDSLLLPSAPGGWTGLDSAATYHDTVGLPLTDWGSAIHFYITLM